MLSVPELQRMYADYSSKPKKIDPDLKRDLSAGWMLRYLFPIDDLISHRWKFWHESMSLGHPVLTETGKCEIPRISFSHPNKSALSMLTKCLNAIPRGSQSWEGWSSSEYFRYFQNWLLWSFGHPGFEEPKEPMGCDGASIRLYQLFDLWPLLLYPYDYLGDITAEARFGRHQGFYPTPMTVTELMVQMLFSGSGKNPLESTMDPAVGTGRMLLSSSNYSLDLNGQDVSRDALLSTVINGYLYCPWLALPFPFTKTGWIILGDALLMDVEKYEYLAFSRKYDKGLTQSIKDAMVYQDLLSTKPRASLREVGINDEVRQFQIW